MDPTSPMMPMGRSAVRLSLDDNPLPDLGLSSHGRAPLSLSGPTSAPSQIQAPSQMAGPGAMPPGGPMQPPAPTKAPWDVQMQDDGSSVYSIPGPNGNPIILGVNPPPRLPKALQTPKPGAK